MIQRAKVRFLFPLAELPPWSRLSLALLPTFLVHLLYSSLPRVLSQTPAAFQYPVVLLAAWLGGLWPGLISTLFSSAFTFLVVRPHLVRDFFSDPQGLIRSFMFFFTGTAFVLFIATLQRALEKADRAVEVRDEFVALASHELRTPLTALQLQADLTKGVITRGAPEPVIISEAKKLIDACVEQVARLDHLVSEMLDLTILQDGRRALEYEELDLDSLITGTVERFRLQAAASGSSLTVNSKSCPGRWDRIRLEQVVSNLVENSIKYGRGQPIEIRLSIFDNRARLEIRDQGIGISKEDRERIFERFERAVPAEKIQGLGLGLYLSGRIVKMHGGSLTVESELGRGSCFMVELPRHSGE